VKDAGYVQSGPSDPVPSARWPGEPPLAVPGTAGDLRALYDAMLSGIVVTDPSGAIVYANAEAERLLQRSSADLHGDRSTFSALADAGDAPPARSVRDGLTVPRDRTPNHRTISVPLPGGGERRLLVGSRPVHGPDGAPLQVVLSFADATQLDRAGDAARRPRQLRVRADGGRRQGRAPRAVTEAALQESEALIRAHLRHSSDVLVVLDADGCIRYASPSVEPALGYDVNEHIGRNAFDFIHPEDRQRVTGSFSHVLGREGRLEPIEFRLRHADGRWRWFEATAINLLHDPGVRGIVENLRDITERHHAEETQRFLANLTAALTESLDYQTRLDVVTRLTVPFFADCCAVDIVTEEEGSVHRMAVACTDTANEVMLLNAYHDFMPVLGRRHPVARVLRNGKAIFLPTVRDQDLQADEPTAAHLDARRSLRLTSLIVVPLAARGRTFGAIVFAQAESARTFTPDDLSLAEEIARRTALALENARLHHDLGAHRKQLQELVGRLLTAQEEERRRVAYDVHDGLAQVAAATHQRLQAFAAGYSPRRDGARQNLEQALALAQRTVREARRVIAGLRPIALDDFGLSTAIQQEAVALRDEGWEVSYHDNLGGRRLPPLIETVLYRVAQESLTNVRKHAGPTHVRLTLAEGEQSVRLEVRDWGRGFARAVRPKAAGEQVGIAGMRERVKLLGGEFYLHSRPGRGTVVIAIVPLPLPEDAPVVGPSDGRTG
jgi:PAS domain S-box-containing protein